MSTTMNFEHNKKINNECSDFVKKEYAEFDKWFKKYYPSSDQITYLFCRSAWMERAIRGDS